MKRILAYAILLSVLCGCNMEKYYAAGELLYILSNSNESVLTESWVSPAGENDIVFISSEKKICPPGEITLNFYSDKTFEVATKTAHGGNVLVKAGEYDVLPVKDGTHSVELYTTVQESGRYVGTLNKERTMITFSEGIHAVFYPKSE